MVVLKINDLIYNVRGKARADALKLKQWAHG